ncbi:MAG TPA: hypothetical protein VF916_00755 [Ktedonobacterales bacterium]
MMEFTLVFRRPVRRSSRGGTAGSAWAVVRPTLQPPVSTAIAADRQADDGEVAQVFVVPICSALGLDGVAYEQFLVESGVLSEALLTLGTLSLNRAADVDTARKEVQALVMAAEVQHIIDRMSA